MGSRSRLSASISLMVSCAVAALGAGCSSPSSGPPLVSDLATDWSDASNPNGVWSYNEASNLLPSVTGWNGLNFATPQTAWARVATGNTFLPAWFKANGTLTSGADFQAGDIVVHSTDGSNGVGAGPANVTWTSPIRGTVDITGFAWNARNIGRNNQWTLFHNGVSMTTGTVNSGAGYSRAIPFLFSAGSGGTAAVSGIAVVKGDVIKLQVATPADPGDFVGVSLTITQIP